MTVEFFSCLRYQIVIFYAVTIIVFILYCIFSHMWHTFKNFKTEFCIKLAYIVITGDFKFNNIFWNQTYLVVVAI